LFGVGGVQRAGLRTFPESDAVQKQANSVASHCYGARARRDLRQAETPALEAFVVQDKTPRSQNAKSLAAVGPSPNEHQTRCRIDVDVPVIADQGAQTVVAPSHGPPARWPGICATLAAASACVAFIGCHDTGPLVRSCHRHANRKPPKRTRLGLRAQTWQFVCGATRNWNEPQLRRAAAGGAPLPRPLVAACRSSTGSAAAPPCDCRDTFWLACSSYRTTTSAQIGRFLSLPMPATLPRARAPIRLLGSERLQSVTTAQSSPTKTTAHTKSRPSPSLMASTPMSPTVAGPRTTTPLNVPRVWGPHLRYPSHSQWETREIGR